MKSENTQNPVPEKQNPGFRLPIAALLLAGLALCQYAMVEASLTKVGNIFIPGKLAGIAVGAATFLFADLLLAALSSNNRLLLGVWNLLILAFSLVSLFTNRLHGSPFTFAELGNTGTALSVLGEYKRTLLHWQKEYTPLLAFFLLSLVLVQGIFLLMKGRTFGRGALAGLLVCGAFLAKGYLVAPLIPEKPVGWSWQEAIDQYSYFPAMIQQTRQEMNPLEKPEGFKKEEIVSFIRERLQEDRTGQGQKAGDRGNRPDIIVVLNESFYDLNQVLDAENSEEPITCIPNLEGAVTGRAIVPNIGGGTNSTEYELLTSNSTNLLAANVTPFNSLNMTGANSAVSYLKGLGYSTLGTHTEGGKNYRRNVGYKGLGFDTIHFAGDYKNKKFYGERIYYKTDECAFENLKGWYEEMGDGPRFLYLLTIQNHGGWEKNPPGEDIIRAGVDFGDYTDDINEFNSCIYLSDKAFAGLTDYFKEADRDVVILMLGDHAPSFLKDVVNQVRPDYDPDRYELDMRSVPFVMWSNNPGLLYKGAAGDTLSVPYLIPTLLESAGVELSGYYDYMIGLRDRFPIITRYGACYDREGSLHRYRDAFSGKDDLMRYFQLVYANIKQIKGTEDFFRLSESLP